MKVFHEFECPACGVKLRMDTDPDWKEGKVRCPSCGKRVSVHLGEKTKKKKTDGNSTEEV